MGVSAVLVQRPGGLVGGGGHRDVVDHRDSHAGMGLQAEYHYGGTDEEDRNDTNCLQ